MSATSWNTFERGGYRVREARSAEDLRSARRLRALAFRGSDTVEDHDAFDAVSRHVLIERRGDNAVAGCFRLALFESGASIEGSYSAQFYDLIAMRAVADPLLELGRFCSHPDVTDPDVLRVAWGALTDHVDRNGIGMLFGCASFPGTDPAIYRDGFAFLADAYLAPGRWRPRVKAPETVPLVRDARVHGRMGQRQIPTLLRTYLAMGGRVSDHAVIDRAMNTLHVFVGVEVARIPSKRKRLLRAMAG